ncbi:MAG: hypothetical protein U0932_15465 [Thiobacillus sp.]|nr:hypothetical protein [Thiobacillus sp.]
MQPQISRCKNLEFGCHDNGPHVAILPAHFHDPVMGHGFQGARQMACARAVKIFLESGSHFLTHADWGCKDGDRKAWLVVDVENKDQARAILPPAYRPHAKIVQLNQFTLSEIDELLRYHAA